VFILRLDVILQSCSVATFSMSQSGTGVWIEPRAWQAREREPITGVLARWGRSPQRGSRPQRGSGAEPLVRGSGGKADFPGCPGFVPCYPASRQDQPRDARCPGFQGKVKITKIIIITIVIIYLAGARTRGAWEG